MTMTADRAATRLRVRRPKLTFDATPKYWVLDDPQATHALNILNFGIPAGERYFMDGVRLAMPYITDRQMRADARAFIGQEANHARLHEKAAEHLNLFDNRPIRGTVKRMDVTRVSLYKRIDSLPEPARRQAVQWWLSGVALGEHLTALFADLVFDETKVDETAVDPDMANLIRWHAAEELEHRNVPFDIFEHIGGSYIQRVAVAVPAFALFPLSMILLTSFLMLADPDIRRPFSLRKYIRGVRARRTPNLLDVLGRFPMYLLPNHHPSRIGHDDRAAAYLAQPQLAGAK